MTPGPPTKKARTLAENLNLDDDPTLDDLPDPKVCFISKFTGIYFSIL